MSFPKFTAVFVLLMVGACSKGAPAIAPAKPAGAEIPAALSSRPVPLRETLSRPEPKKKALPAVCPKREGVCEELGPVFDALAASELTRASSLLEKVDVPETPSDRAIYLLLKGRCRLESDSLSYGEGGPASEEALVLFETAEQIADIKDPVRLQVARAQLSLGRGEQAVSTLSALAERYQGDAEVQAALGIAHISTGRAARALAPLRLAVALDPKQPERLIVLGTAHLLLGDLVEAERRFRGALSLDSGSARAHGDLGAVLLIQGKIREGKAHLLRAADLAPLRATYAANLSYAELLSGEPVVAEKWARRAIELDPELASAWLNLGLSLVAREDRKAAREAFQKAQQLDPTDPRAANNLRDLDELEGALPPGAPVTR